MCWISYRENDFDLFMDPLNFSICIKCQSLWKVNIKIEFLNMIVILMFQVVLYSSFSEPNKRSMLFLVNVCWIFFSLFSWIVYLLCLQHSRCSYLLNIDLNRLQMMRKIMEKLLKSTFIAVIAALCCHLSQATVRIEISIEKEIIRHSYNEHDFYSFQSVRLLFLLTRLYLH